MKAAINDLSFKRAFPSKQEAIEKVRQWMDICKKIESGEMTAVKKLYLDNINTSAEIAPDFPLINLIKDFQTRDERSYLIHLLANLSSPEYEEEVFVWNDENSKICAWAKDDIVVSLESDVAFEQSIIKGEIASKQVLIKNISHLKHMNLYAELLGIRCYEPNKKHGRVAYIDTVGRHVAPMDLDGKEAQKLLNKAIEIDGNLFGKKGDKYYSFQRHHRNCYHGYQNNDLSEHITREIDKQTWE